MVKTKVTDEEVVIDTPVEEVEVEAEPQPVDAGWPPPPPTV